MSEHTCDYTHVYTLPGDRVLHIMPSRHGYYVTDVDSGIEKFIGRFDNPLGTAIYVGIADGTIPHV